MQGLRLDRLEILGFYATREGARGREAELRELAELFTLSGSTLAPERPDPTRAARMAEIDDELATFRRIAERGNSRHAAQLVADLERERAEIAAPQNRSGAPIDFEALRPAVEASVREMRAAFEGDATERRVAFRALLGASKIRVLADPERTFRVEGVLWLPLEMRIARVPHEEAGRFKISGSGGPLGTGIRAVLRNPVGRVSFRRRMWLYG